jgi:hypothetical protein
VRRNAELSRELDALKLDFSQSTSYAPSRTWLAVVKYRGQKASAVATKGRQCPEIASSGDARLSFEE